MFWARIMPSMLPLAPVAVLFLLTVSLLGLRRREVTNWALFLSLAIRSNLAIAALGKLAGLFGYVPDSRGRLWVVAAFVNDAQASKGRASLDALMDWIARQ